MKKVIVLLVFLVSSLGLHSQQTIGLFYNHDDAMNGYTLFANNEITYLIDNCGYVVNEWESEYWCNNGLALSRDGKLVRQGKVQELNLFGGSAGIIEIFDWQGNLEWSYLFDEHHVSHHDLLLLPNGNILVNVWERISAEQAEEAGKVIPGAFYNDAIWEIKPLPDNEAEIVWRWSFLDHVIQDVDSTKANYGVIADHPELLDINYIVPEININADWLHCNTLGYHAEYDQILISSRNTSEIYIIDHSTTTEEAASNTGGIYGKGGDILYRHGNPEAYDHGTPEDRVLYQSHDVNWIEHGPYKNDFIVFNNKYITGTRSRIQIWKNPSADGFYQFSNEDLYGQDEILWTYDTLGFYSPIMSSAQYLPNGNILTTEGATGEISEITPVGETVWKYINPVDKILGPMAQGDFPPNNSLFKSYRYTPDFEGFENFELAPGEPVERMPEESDCQISAPNSTDDKGLNMTVPFLVTQEYLKPIDPLTVGRTFTIINHIGQIIQHFDIVSFNQTVDIAQLHTGVYIVLGNNLKSQRFIKL